MAQRRLEGLCFNCPEKFSPEHAKICTKRGIFYLEVSDMADAEELPSEDEMQVSLCATTGICAGATLQLVALVRHHRLLGLVDSGSTHSFVAADTARRLGLQPEPRPVLTVGVANGDRVPCDGVCKHVSVMLDKEEFTMDLYVLPLGGFDLVLGCDWLRTLGPILWNFEHLSMAFWRGNHTVKLIGVNAPPAPCVTAAEVVSYMNLLLQEFTDLFMPPQGLPPQHSFDHRIHLMPGTVPVAVRPYRYA